MSLPDPDEMFRRYQADHDAKVAKAERERIRANILDRAQDLMSCNKNDDCNEWGQHIESYIQEWLDDGENK